MPIVLASMMLAVWAANDPGYRGTDDTTIPWKIYNSISAEPGSHKILVDYNISSSIVALISDSQSALDGRIDRYGPNGARDYVETLKYAEPGWQKRLARYPGTTDAVLLSTAPLVNALEEEGWTVAGTASGLDGDYLWLVPPRDSTASR